MANDYVSKGPTIYYSTVLTPVITYITIYGCAKAPKYKEALRHALLHVQQRHKQTRTQTVHVWMKYSYNLRKL